MDAALISVGLFLTWGMIGFGPLAVLAGERPLIVRTLLAPSMGVALVTIPAFLINRSGYPVQSFAAWQIAFLVVGSVLATLLAYRRRFLSFGNEDIVTSGWLLLLLFVAIALVGWPGLIHGLNWLGYANDDMANYALSATRLMSHGYFEPPVVKAVLDGSDMSQLYWHLTLETRCGGDMMLAVIASMLKIDVAPIFMPTMIALHATLIAAAAGLVVTEQPRRIIAITAVIVGAINPLIGFSTYSEVLAQVGGLAQAAGLLAILVDPWQPNAREMVSRAAAAGFLLFGLFIWYYEVLALVLPAIGLYVLLHPHELLATWKRLIVSAVAVVSCIALLSGVYLQAALRTMQVQLQSGSIAYPSDVIVFPYFLIKEGLSSFWGLSPIISQDTLPNWKLMLSLMLFGLAAAALVSALRHRRLSACLVAVLSTVALSLLWRQADFGIFKAVLYLQPFLSAFVAAAVAPIIASIRFGGEPRRLVWLKRPRIRSFRTLGSITLSLAVCAIAAIAAIAAVNQLSTFIVYGRIAADQFGPVYFNQLSGGSRLGLLSVLNQLPRPKSGGHYVIDSDNSVLTKLLTLYTAGTPVRIFSYNPFKTPDFLASFNRNFPERANETSADRTINIPFNWTTSGENDVLRLQPQSREQPTPGDFLIAAAADNSVLNRLQLGYPTNTPVVVRAIENVTNHLAFLPTLEKGRHYFDYDIPPEKFREYRRNIALWPNEPDYFYKERTMVGAGRYVLLRVINPEKKPRLMLELTASLQSNGDNRLPPVKLFDRSTGPIKTVGRGSARLISQPIEPLRFDSAWVFGIDMGIEGRRFTDARGNFTLDPRVLTSFVRDISLITDDAYREIKPPSNVTRFPDDLANKSLEYSGIYEDGWMAESAVMRLAGSTQPAQFAVAGMMPWNPKTSGVSQLVVRIDGVEKARYSLAQGQFFIPIYLEPSEKPIWVEIQADGATPLGPGDRRPVSVRLTRVGWNDIVREFPSEFTPTPDTVAKVDAVGFWSDGWSATHSELTLASGGDGILTIKGTIPNLGHPFATTLTVAVNGAQIGTTDIAPGDITARFPVSASAGPRRIVLDFADGQDLRPPDDRRGGMMVHAISLSRTAP